MTWRDQAACRRLEPSVVRGLGEDVDGWVGACCGACPVRDDCYGEAVKNREWGVWGGVGFRDGRPVRRAKRRVRGRETAVEVPVVVRPAAVSRCWSCEPGLCPVRACPEDPWRRLSPHRPDPVSSVA